MNLYFSLKTLGSFDSNRATQFTPTDELARTFSLRPFRFLQSRASKTIGPSDEPSLSTLATLATTSLHEFKPQHTSTSTTTRKSFSALQSFIRITAGSKPHFWPINI